MILEEGTDEQMKECAWRACLPIHGERWLLVSHADECTVVCKAFRVITASGGFISVFHAQNHNHLRVESVSVEDWLHALASGNFKRRGADDS
jgi:hypothetical protein